MIHSSKFVGSVSGRNRHIRLKKFNQINKSITSFEIHIKKHYKAIISTDESHASLKTIKLRERPFENHGGGRGVGGWGVGGGGHGFFSGSNNSFHALLETINFFHTRSDKVFFSLLTMI